MKLKEALEYLKPFRFEDKMVEEAYDTIKKVLTPPTADEVCIALNERYNNSVFQYLKDNKSFVFGYMLRPVCRLKEDKTIDWATNDLPPHLITLIGRFYEGLEE